MSKLPGVSDICLWSEVVNRDAPCLLSIASPGDHGDQIPSYALSHDICALLFDSHLCLTVFTFRIEANFPISESSNAYFLQLPQCTLMSITHDHSYCTLGVVQFHSVATEVIPPAQPLPAVPSSRLCVRPSCPPVPVRGPSTQAL